MHSSFRNYATKMTLIILKMLWIYLDKNHQIKKSNFQYVNNFIQETVGHILIADKQSNYYNPYHASELAIIQVIHLKTLSCNNRHKICVDIMTGGQFSLT